MTRTFCDKCGAEARDSYSDASIKIGERKKFQLRAIFELVEDPSPCGSIGLSHPKTSSADICRLCQLELVELLRLKLENSGAKS